MAITITGTVVIDETSGTQNPADSTDAAGNDVAGGAGVLPTGFDAALLDLGLTINSTSSVAVSGASADNSTGTAMITGLPSNMADLFWSTSTGVALNGVDSGLATTDGTTVFLYTYSGDNNVLFAVKADANGNAVAPTAVGAEIVFAAYLDTGGTDAGASSAKVWVVQFEPLFNPDASDPDDPVSPSNVLYVAASQPLNFSLAGAPSGQNLFLMYGTPGDGNAGNGDEVALVVTAKDPANNTVNSSQGGGGTTLGSNNQMLDPSEGLIFTFVTNAEANYTVPNLTHSEAIDANNIQFQGVFQAQAATFSVVQTQPASKAGTLTFKAFETAAESGANYIPGLTGDSPVDISSVVVKDAGGNIVNLTVTISGNSATIVGVKAGYTIDYTTSGDHDRVEIDNSASGHGQNNAAFDIGGFSLVTNVVEPALFNALTFEDDAPTLALGNLVGTGSTLPQVGYWDMSAGADGLGSSGLDISLDAATLVRPDSSTVAVSSFTFSEDSGSPDSNGDYLFSGSLTGDFDNDANTDDTTVDFTLIAYPDGHYALDLEQGFASTVTLDTADGALRAGGPDPVQTLVIPAPPADPITDVVFFSALVTASDSDLLADIGLGATDPTEGDLQGPPLAAGIDARSMNVSTSGIGVDNNVLQGDTNAAIGGTDESFVINPGILVSSVEIFVDNSVQGYSYSSGERMYYKAFYEDGSNSGLVAVTTDLGLTNKGQPGSFTVDGGGQLIDAVQLIMAKGDVKIPHIVFAKETASLASDVILDFTATVTDGDGDTATSAFSASLLANELSGSYDYVLNGTLTAPDAFNVDLSTDLTTYQVNGFDASTDLRDKLVLIGDATATVQSITLVNGNADSLVTIAETGGQTTTVTVMGVTDLTSADVAFG